MKKILIFTLVLLSFIVSSYKRDNVSMVNAENYSSEIVMDVNTNRVLYKSNENAKKYMASTTKILTALVIIENCNLNDVVTVTKDTIGIEGSSIYLEAGEKLTVKELLYGLMLRSGNDCAETLAVFCSQNIKNFANLMNDTAKKIGANNSNFVNPHGLHNDNHYTTAYDLALISCYAMKNQAFREIVGTKSVDISFSTRNYKRHLVNKNKMLNEYEGSTGIKTGFTKKAGRCLVSSCYRNGMELVCVVLNCPPMFERSKALFSSCFECYKPIKLVESDNIIDFIEVVNSKDKCPIGINNDIIVPLSDEEITKVNVVYDYDNSISKPYKKNAEIGYVKIYMENNLIFQQKIYTILDSD